MKNLAEAEQLPTHRMRADASRNRERIVAAARQAFIEQGVDVPLDEIARRAGVGNATLYRHFEDRRALIHSVAVAVIERTASQAVVALADAPDPFEALRRFVHSAADERTSAIIPLLAEWIDKTEPELAALVDRVLGAVQEIVGRAQSTGQLRTDVTVEDVMVTMCQLTRPLTGTSLEEAEAFAHRHLELLLDGMRAPARSVLPALGTRPDGLRHRGDAATPRSH